MPFNITIDNINKTYSFKENNGPFPAEYRLGLLKQINIIFNNNLQYAGNTSTFQDKEPRAFLEQKAQELLTPGNWLDWFVSLFYTTEYQGKVQELYQRFIESPDVKFSREVRVLAQTHRLDDFRTYLRTHRLPSQSAIDQIANELLQTYTRLKSYYDSEWKKANDYSITYDVEDSLPPWDNVNNARQSLVEFYQHIGRNIDADIIKATSIDYLGFISPH
ncbi:MAG TPA: hypothetical protein VHK67_00035 [Rhabdochlamydiaceae bacterium]|jgi:hypothetical protein|nr:hypothetical protein [Rhabdochlamydiaceae bacterium]